MSEEPDLFFHRKTYDPKTSRSFGEVLVPARMTFTPLCPAIVPGQAWEPPGSMLRLDFVLLTPECRRTARLELLCRSQLGNNLSSWMADGFGLCFGDDHLYLACAEATCWALQVSGVLAHFALHNPKPVGGTVCAECGCPGAYLGFSTAECVSRYCPRYVPRGEDPGKVSIPF